MTTPPLLQEVIRKMALQDWYLRLTIEEADALRDYLRGIQRIIDEAEAGETHGESPTQCPECNKRVSLPEELLVQEHARTIEECAQAAESLKIPSDEYDDAGWWNAQEEIAARIRALAKEEA